MSKLENLINWFNDKNKVIVALSGGVDSALVAYAAHKKLGDSAIAVTADYKTLSNEELDSAKQICSEIGISHILIDYDELENPEFIRNDSNRCFYCRLELGSHLLDVARNYGANVIVDGTNIDDLGDYRPGLEALKKNGIRNPLVETEFSKKEIRDFAKSVGLSVFDKPSNSCLASRIPWGQQITAERLARIEYGENVVKQMTKVRQVRVRDIGGLAKIEVEKNDIPIFNPDMINQIFDKLRLVGFSSIEIDKDGYKPGKINVIAD
ncbi:ATP-dependent sacrificial sulfur transferase LarE [Nitrosopumilus sp. K4]|uniref:ATP-dependent sacrificial sulfur transferase LarE n=1 Tax=Nitrosopumilus sp. K4 TaxID=2795383 RepID=UPI001BA8A72B|nr:ATP-dependent sacrificial sulfur transferase LarE [Nitrosopumilus sp. K4]QUC64197.1 ATP-dependent sacrificial sulfur transferase LarE [Nitrosopumilus sp. K4]